MDTVGLRTHAAVALLAAVAAVGGSLLLVGVTPAFVVAGAAAGLLALTPDTFLAVGIATLGTFGKPLLALGAGLVTVGLYTVLVLAVLRWAEGTRRKRLRGTLGTFVLVGVVSVVLAEDLASALGASLGAAFVVLLGADPLFRPEVADTRRRVLRAGAAAIGVLGAGTLVSVAGRGGDTPEETVDPEAQALLDVASDRSFRVEGLEGLVSTSFYKVDINSADPDLEASRWSLSVTGAVDSELVLGFDDLRELPAEHRFVTLRCVNDPVNGRIMDTALWTGVPVKEVLDAAGAPETCCVTLHAADGYFVSFERSALDPGLLAFAMNGTSLPRGHGYPLRALIPGRWGETNTKWLTEIEVREMEGEGYWENRGWKGTGDVHTIAKLHSVVTEGGTVTLAGHTYAGTRGIDRVELSTDGGETWNEATLTDPLPGAMPVGSSGDSDDGNHNTTATDSSPTGTATPAAVDPQGEAMDAWRMWRYEYEASEKHEVVVRAVDGTGTLQPKEDRKPYPEGSTGWVRETVKP